MAKPPGGPRDHYGYTPSGTRRKKTGATGRPSQAPRTPRATTGKQGAKDGGTDSGRSVRVTAGKPAGTRGQKPGGAGKPAAKNQRRGGRRILWGRVLVALLALAAAIAGLAWGISKIPGLFNAAAQRVNTPTDTAPVTEQTGLCTAESLSVNLRATPAGIGKLNFTVDAVNTGGEPCLLGIGQAQVKIAVSGASGAVWDSSHCPAGPRDSSRELPPPPEPAPTNPITPLAQGETKPTEPAPTPGIVGAEKARTFKPGENRTVMLVPGGGWSFTRGWNGEISAPQCPPTPGLAPQGSYTAQATLDKIGPVGQPVGFTR